MVTPEQFRGALARVPSAVTVVTALGSDGPSGATANAVTSLSLDPPLMLAALDRDSRTLAVVRETGAFGVNVLAGDQGAVARRFATKDPRPRKWAGVEWVESAGLPRIAGTLVWIACELRELHDGGDHEIAVGTVTVLDAGEGDPLAYVNRRYLPFRPGP